jgi:hypothetical protein
MDQELYEAFPDAAAAVAHITSELIGEFIADLTVRVGSVTRAQWLQRIHQMAQLLAPEGDYNWLKEIVRQFKDEERPRPKAHRIVDMVRIVETDIKLMICSRHGMA